MASYIYVPQQNPPPGFQPFFDPLQSMAATVPPVIGQPHLSHQQTAMAQHPVGLQPIHQLLLSGATVAAGRDMTAGIKRGSEDMLTQPTQMVNNASGVTILNELSPDLEPNDAKKVKYEPTTDANANQTALSKVIEVSNVPPDTRETDLVQIAVPFGKVTNVAIARNKNKAYIEMGELSQAAACINYHQSVPARVKNSPVQLQFSAHHKELKADQNPAAVAAISAANTAQVGLADPNDPKTVLHIIVDNLVFPVSIDVLKQIFSRYGQVLKIIIFNKNNQFQALVQYSDQISAHTAKVSLDGQNIYNNCCTLRIDFSKLGSLNIKYNNEKSRDYTNLNLPTGDGNPNSQSPGLDIPSPTPNMMHVTPGAGSVANGVSYAPSSLAQAQAAIAASAAMSGLQSSQNMAGFGAPITYLSPSGVPQAMHPMPYQVTNLPPHLTQSLGHIPQGLAPAGLPAGLTSHHGMPPLPNINPAAMMGMGLAPSIASQMAANLAARLPAGMAQSGCVILVSNLDEEKATPDDLFTLFGVYGDVIRVKILYNKKDNALLQYSEPTQAQLALTHLDKIKVWGKQIRVAPSKHPIVQMPTDLQADGARLTKDYTNSPLHRYKKKGSKNYQNIYPPSATLHLSNIPPDVQGELLKTEFAKYGTVTAFKFFEKDHKMALIQMETIDDAVMGLVAMHNFEFGVNKMHLKVAFSKFYI
ncbi:polypyrimidine tract-binding protein 2-like isoform X3 [Watersipora subatra]|uniref:polypyrimidine tract-binding protein 2-like isoform X3 n=1 Tax=Watersipora subatra TaxID=2589382 RepID=UPI00355C391C